MLLGSSFEIVIVCLPGARVENFLDDGSGDSGGARSDSDCSDSGHGGSYWSTAHCRHHADAYLRCRQRTDSAENAANAQAAGNFDRTREHITAVSRQSGQKFRVNAEEVEQFERKMVAIAFHQGIRLSRLRKQRLPFPNKNGLNRNFVTKTDG